MTEQPPPTRPGRQFGRPPAGARPHDGPVDRPGGGSDRAVPAGVDLHDDHRSGDRAVGDHGRAASAADPTGRYAELTYTSFDGGVGGVGGVGGGWQVKQARGLGDREIDALRAQVSTQLDAGVELPRFPTPEQIAAFPRRLAYLPAGPGLDPGAAAWWHVAPAGTDASGRPGNVFCQALLDRHPDRPPHSRPIDLWRSPSWLTPYGSEQVAAAELPTRPPVGGGVISRDSLIDFCFADFERIAVLGPLLDACAAALAGGPRVILTVADTDRAAQWIGAVSYLTDAPTARRLYFSTLERGAALGDAVHRGQHLICLPIADLDEADRLRSRLGTPTVLLAEDEFPDLGDLGGPDDPMHPHRTGHGDQIPVTPWSVLARVVLEAETPAHARAVLERLDPIAEEVSGLSDPAGYSPDWPLAMAIAQSGDLFAEARAEAALVIGQHSPPDLDRRPALFGPAATLIATQCGSSTAEAWRQLRATGAPTTTESIGRVLIFDSYLRRAIDDDAWLTRPDGVPLPDPTPSRDDARLREVVDRRLQTLATQPQVDPMLLGRLADLLARTGLAVGRTAEWLIDLAGRHLVPALTGPQGPSLAERIGPVAEPTLETIIRPAFALEPPHPDALGRRLPAALVDWLYPRPPQPTTVRSLHNAVRTGRPPEDYWLRAERDWSVYLRGGVGALETDEIGYAIWALADASSRLGHRDAWREPVVDWRPGLPLLRAPIDPDDLYWLVHHYQPERRSATELAAATLLTVPWTGHRWSEALQRLCRQLARGDRRDPQPVPDRDHLPQIREVVADGSWATAWWAPQTAAILTSIRSWMGRTDLPPVEAYAVDLRRGVGAILIVELIGGRQPADVAGLLQRFGPSTVPIDRELSTTLATVIGAGEKLRRDNRGRRPPYLIGFAEVAAAALRADPELLAGRLADDGARWLAGFRSPQGHPILEDMIGSWLARTADRDQQRRLREETTAVLARSLSAADNQRELDRVVSARLKELRRNRGGS